MKQLIQSVLKKTCGLFLCSSLAAGSLAGCTNISRQSPPEMTHGEKTDTGHTQEALTISNILLPEELLNEFHDAYPDINLEIVNYSGTNYSGYSLYSLKNGDIPDIYITTQSFDEEAQVKYLLDLSNYDFLNHYSSTLLTSLDISGGIYLLPAGYQLSGIYYNKTILEENGWDVPDSFEELVALSKEIEAAGYQPVGHAMQLEGYPLNFFFNLGNTVYFSTLEGTQWKEDFPKGNAAAAGNDGLRNAMEYYDQWIRQGFITTEHTSYEQFYNGKCVFYLSLPLKEYEYTTTDGKVYQFGTLPWLSEDGSNNMLTRSVSKHIGIRKSLSEPGNEQKLKDALTFLRFVSTAKGQQAFMSNNQFYMPSLTESELPENSPYQELADIVTEGRTVPLVYVGWEKQLIPIAQEIKNLISGDTDIDGLIQAFDHINEGLLHGDSADIYAQADQTLTLEQTARLAAIAEGKATNADCAIISINHSHDLTTYNSHGIAWYLYKGPINSDCINMIRPGSDTISILEMTGAEIRDMQAAGFDLHGNGKPYEYFLFTKGDMELDDSTTYRLAVSTEELTQDMLARATETDVSPAQAITDYLNELKHVRDNNILWD